ncbi:phosphatase PAP2 family protein [uncultured Prevotella sp.]|uniref:phosphatase PAP2 family protein n=1 Tax=uncultured Prevotella sp. TaxID=159272 RepID=UPI0026136D0D|nr:phosphatase PAP2 family protein [uncultured Prevotella sp.]
MSISSFGQASTNYKRYHGDGIDDVLQYTPMAASFLLKAAGVKCRSSWEQWLYKSGASFILCSGTTYLLKHSIHKMRPDGTDNRSFPSGHTAIAFSGATVLHKEFGKTSPWISVAGYTVATITAVDRVRRNRHHWEDVATGAAIGFLSAQASYWIVDKITAKCKKKKKDADGNTIEEEQKIQIGVAPDGLAMVIKL